MSEANEGTIMPRFTVEPADGWTECDCPESLCVHDDGMRPYRAWTVWDNERDEHGFITMPDVVGQAEYLRKRDAAAAAKRAEDSAQPGTDR